MEEIVRMMMKLGTQSLTHKWTYNKKTTQQ